MIEVMNMYMYMYTVDMIFMPTMQSLTCLPVGSMSGLGLYLRVGRCDQYNGIDPRV